MGTFYYTLMTLSRNRFNAVIMYTGKIYCILDIVYLAEHTFYSYFICSVTIIGL